MCQLFLQGGCPVPLPLSETMYGIMYHDGGAGGGGRDGIEHLPDRLHQHDTYELFISISNQYHFFFRSYPLLGGSLVTPLALYLPQSHDFLWWGPSPVLPPGATPSDIPPAFLTFQFFLFIPFLFPFGSDTT